LDAAAYVPTPADEDLLSMNAQAAALPLPRPWVTPTLTEHGPLAALAHAAGAVPMVAALLQITVSCVQNPPSCTT
jgi:hypothetical protein